MSVQLQMILASQSVRMAEEVPGKIIGSLRPSQPRKVILIQGDKSTRKQKRSGARQQPIIEVFFGFSAGMALISHTRNTRRDIFE